LEDKVFEVSPGTLTPSANSTLNNQADLLTRLGEGKIEQRFSLQPQSMRESDFQKARNLNIKTKSLFNDANSAFLLMIPSASPQLTQLKLTALLQTNLLTPPVN
jgi:hypothetical protein